MFVPSERPTRRSPWVGLDLRFLTLTLPSRLDHRLTHAGPQQQQQVSVEFERFRFIASAILETPPATCASSGSSLLHLR
jgi:hypothetical protein